MTNFNTRQNIYPRFGCGSSERCKNKAAAYYGYDLETTLGFITFADKIIYHIYYLKRSDQHFTIIYRLKKVKVIKIEYVLEK